MNNRDWFVTVFRTFITIFVFCMYIALVFYNFTGNFSFLLTFNYWSTTISSTVLALMFRWLYSDSGVDKEIDLNIDIKDKEIAKGLLIKEVSKNDLNDLLKIEIDTTNEAEKLKEYKTKCDKKILFYKQKRWYVPFRMWKLNKWHGNKYFIEEDEFNINAIKVKYYRYDLDEMLTTFYKQPNKDRNTRVTKNQTVMNSTRTNVITLLAFMILKGIEVFSKGFQREDLFILFGQLTIFSINIYTGYNLGRDYIKNSYSSNLTQDYTYLRGFIKKYKT